MVLYNEEVLLIILALALALAAFLWYSHQRRVNGGPGGNPEDNGIEGSPVDLSHKDLLAIRYPNAIIS